MDFPIPSSLRFDGAAFLCPVPAVAICFRAMAQDQLDVMAALGFERCRRP
jgi:hypothetical protein